MREKSQAANAERESLKKEKRVLEAEIEASRALLISKTSECATTAQLAEHQRSDLTRAIREINEVKLKYEEAMGHCQKQVGDAFNKVGCV